MKILLIIFTLLFLGIPPAKAEFLALICSLDKRPLYKLVLDLKNKRWERTHVPDGASDSGYILISPSTYRLKDASFDYSQKQMGGKETGYHIDRNTGEYRHMWGGVRNNPHPIFCEKTESPKTKF